MEIAVRVIGGNLLTELADPLLDLLGGNQNPQVGIDHATYGSAPAGWRPRYPPLRNPGAAGADVDVGAGRFARNGMAEGVVGDVILGQVLAKPGALRRVRKKGNIDAAAVVEAHGLVDGGFAHSAHGQRLAELLLESVLHFGKERRGKDAVAVEALGQAAGNGRGLALQIFLGSGPSPPIAESSSARDSARAYSFLAARSRPRGLPGKSAGRDLSLDQLFLGVEGLSAAFDAAGGRGDHLVGRSEVKSEP